MNTLKYETPVRREPQFCTIRGSAVGDSDFIPIQTLNQASAAFRAFCEQHALGNRDAGTCEIWQGNKVVAHVSYNGKVWRAGAKSWGVDAEAPIFDPYAPEIVCAS